MNEAWRETLITFAIGVVQGLLFLLVMLIITFITLGLLALTDLVNVQISW